MKWIIVAAAVLLSGCAQFQNVTLDQLRDARHKGAEGEIALSIPQIRKAMHDYGSRCQSIGNLSIDPSNPDLAHYSTFMPGLTDSSAALLIDLQQVGLATRYKGYVYYSTWQGYLDRAINVMKGQGTCSK